MPPNSDPFDVGSGVHFLSKDDWRDFPDEDDPDDEEIPETPEDVKAILGFDPEETSA